jgi:hypothetical protein
LASLPMHILRSFRLSLEFAFLAMSDATFFMIPSDCGTMEGRKRLNEGAHRGVACNTTCNSTKATEFHILAFDCGWFPQAIHAFVLCSAA